MTRFIDRHRIDVPAVVGGVALGALAFSAISIFAPRPGPRAAVLGPVEEQGPSIDLIEPGVVDAKLRAQEGHILELRVRVEALEKAIGKGVER